MQIRIPNDFSPRPYQKAYFRHFDNGGKFACCVIHRRAGKDITALHQLCKMAHERKGVYWHALPSYSQAKKAIWNGFRSDGKRILDNVFPPALVARRNETELLLELKCGSIVQLVGSDNIDTLVGTGPVGVNFSEYALSKPSSFDLVAPILWENGGWASFISTPRGKNHLWKLYTNMKGEKSWLTQHLSIADTGALPLTLVEQERKRGRPEALIQQEYFCSFDAAMVGSVFGDLVTELEKRGAVGDFPHGTDAVFTAWDLGFSDSTAIWFFRVRDRGVEFIDHYVKFGQPLSHYFQVVDEKPYQYIKHFLPHDARARTLGATATVAEQFTDRYGSGKVTITPDAKLLDGVQSGRWLLQREDTRIHSRCQEGLEALKHYHYDFDEDARGGDGWIDSKKPVHDWSSHTADAFRYASVACRMAGIMRPEAPAKPKPIAVPVDGSFQLNELWDTAPKSDGRI